MATKDTYQPRGEMVHGGQNNHQWKK